MNLSQAHLTLENPGWKMAMVRKVALW